MINSLEQFGGSSELKLLTHLNAEGWSSSWLKYISEESTPFFDEHYYRDYLNMLSVAPSYTSNDYFYLGFYPDGLINNNGPKYIGVFKLLHKKRIFNTIMIIEDAGRAYTTVGVFGSGSSRPSPLTTSPKPAIGDVASNTNARRVYAWADPDAFANGFSGPSNSTGSKVAKINNNPTPVGGPASCTWKTNNCGPNDEPFSFHTGGVTGVMGDGSVRFIRDSIDAVVLKYAIGASDGQITDLDK